MTLRFAQSAAVAAVGLMAAAGHVRADEGGDASPASDGGDDASGASEHDGGAGGAEKGVFGIGLILGEPTGVSAKYYLADDTAIDGAIGAAFLGRGVQVHADFLLHPWILERKSNFVLPFYLGVGVRVLNHDEGGSEEDHVRIGVRVPVGILFDFTSIPIDVFAELAGVADYHTAGESQFGLDVNGGVGARYYF